MLDFLFTKKEQETAKDAELNRVYEELKKAYPFDNIPEIRKNIYLCISKNMDI